jgi:hypothetical protein
MPPDVRKVYDFPEYASMNLGAMPLMRGAASLNQKLTLTERQSLSAHQAAEPQTHIGREIRSGYCPVANLDHPLERRIMRKNFVAWSELDVQNAYRHVRMA